MSVLAQFLKKITLQENANGIGKVFWAQIKIVTRYVFLYILTFDADFSTKTAEPGNWGGLSVYSEIPCSTSRVL